MPKFRWNAQTAGTDGLEGIGCGGVKGPEGYTEEDARRDVTAHVRKRVPDSHDIKLVITPADDD